MVARRRGLWAARGGLVLLALGLVIGGCTNLSGTWSGDIECEGDLLPTEIELIKQGKVYTGNGLVEGFQLQGWSAHMEFEVQLETTEPTPGPQPLEMVIDSCLYVAEGYTSFADACGDDPHGVDWDGEDTIAGGLRDFMESGVDCSFEVVR